ncbi:hypothetical protein L3Q82_013643 [Scortum barcoo]|uniref:Uncharacterized protein n=1 Tax=Scortum barcoo TaxID=214431 RepID=A0ACB8W1D9_9TELE|nr:hypothetical protein L3Q82_013643 [Scortum barcoo]
MESPARSTIKYPSQGLQEGHQVLCTAVRPVGTNNSKRPIPNPKAQGSDPLVHRGELQHMAAELGSYEQAHTSSPPPLTLGNSRVVEGPAPLKELGSRAQAMRGGIGSSRPPCHDCYPNHIAPAPHGPSCGCGLQLDHGDAGSLLASGVTDKKDKEQMVVFVIPSSFQPPGKPHHLSLSLHHSSIAGA